VRDWLYPCGTAKTCLFYPRAKKRSDEQNSDNEKEDDSKNKNKNKTILVNMLNPDQALKVVASFSQFSGQLDERYKDIRCFMVPASPDIPLPPPLMDDTSKKVLGTKLWNNFVGLETAHSERDAKDTKTENPSDNTNKEEPKLLDAEKVAAAAGGAYDQDEDPLNAPQVLEAVKEFRRKLDKTHGSQKTQRMELVAKKLKELRPRIRARVKAEKEGKFAQPPPGLPPPGPPMGLPPPPPPPGRTTAQGDSGKRGRSNLPAWMTQQQQQAESADEPSNKKLKLDYPLNFPPNLPVSCHATLRQFLANEVKNSLGEEEATLIDFLHKHILQGKATAELLQELKVVLEEEADAFLKAVWSKVKELQQQ